MLRCRASFSLIWLLNSIATGQPSPSPKVQATDQERIQGTWTAIEIIASGEKCPKKQVAGVEKRFKGNKIEYTFPGPADPDVATKFSIVLDPSKTPKGIDMVPLDGGWKDLKMPGIYRLEGDALTICISDGPSKGRPKEFAAPKGSTQVLMKFKRTEK